MTKTGSHNSQLRCGLERGKDMRHNPQSAFWELMLWVTAWSAQL